MKLVIVSVLVESLFFVVDSDVGDAFSVDNILLALQAFNHSRWSTVLPYKCLNACGVGVRVFPLVLNGLQKWIHQNSRTLC